MEDRIKRFVECLLPVTACNMKCSYCYVIQRDNRKMQMPKLKYSPERIGQGLSQERWGGVCYFSICGAGETLLPKEIVSITKEILKQGHYVNLTTNGTISNRINELLDLPKDMLNRVHFAFSFHYLELLRLNKINIFFENVRSVRNAGCSFVVQINLCDEYEPYLQEIKNICMDEIGAWPQVAATRKEINLKNNIELMTEHTYDDYMSLGKTFKSPLFDFTMENFNKKQKGFCYAGDWTGVLNLENGYLYRCYASNIKQDIFADVNSPINFVAIGAHCRSPFCMNSSHFLSLGACPELSTPTYVELRRRDDGNWYSEMMKKFLSGKLQDNNQLYQLNSKEIRRTECYARKEVILSVINNFKRIIKKIIKNRSDRFETKT